MSSTRVTQGLVAAVDVGTTKVCCAVAQPDIHGNLRVLSVGYHASKGVKSGIVIDIDQAEDAVVQAVQSAELAAGETLERVVVNIAGGHLLSEVVHMSMSLRSVDITTADIQALTEKAAQKVQGHDFEVVHMAPLSYEVSGVTGIKDPRGMSSGDTFGCAFHILTAALSPYNSLIKSLQRCHLNVQAIEASAQASGRSALVLDEMELGVTVLDIGGGVTDIGVFYEGQFVFSDTVPIAGWHITSDLAQGLGTSFSHAERIKNLYGSVVLTLKEKDERVMVPVLDGGGARASTQVTRQDITDIIVPRVEEILEMVAERLQYGGYERIGGQRFVLTGGGSQLAGIRALCSRYLNRQVRLGKPLKIIGDHEILNMPGFSTCAGLLGRALVQDTQRSADKRGVLKRMGLWLERNF